LIVEVKILKPFISEMAIKRSATLDIIRTTEPILDTLKDYEFDLDEGFLDEDGMIHKLGYRVELKRSLNGFMNLSIGFIEISVYLSIMLTYNYSLMYGGPSMMLWSYIVNFICSIAVVLSLGELCSCYPTVGGVYHWSAQVVPKEYAPLCSYITGWLLLFGNTTADSSFACGCATFLSSARMASGYEGITPQDQVGVAMLILLLWTLLSMVKIGHFGVFCNVAAMIQYGSLVFTIVTLLTLASRYSSDVFVLSGYYNGSGGFPKSYLGILSVGNAAFSLIGQ
jgi:amino acid transporter